jgi:hypothetical protein
MLTIDGGIKYQRSRCTWYEVLPRRNGIVDIASWVKYIIVLLSHYFIFFFVGFRRHGHQFFMPSQNENDIQNKPGDREYCTINATRYYSKTSRKNDKKNTWNNSKEQNKKSPIKKATSFWCRHYFHRVVDRLVLSLCHGHQFLMPSHHEKNIQNKPSDREYRKINATRFDCNTSRNKDKKNTWNNSPKDTNENPMQETTSLRCWIFFHRFLHGIFLCMVPIYQKVSRKLDYS